MTTTATTTKTMQVTNWPDDFRELPAMIHEAVDKAMKAKEEGDIHGSRNHLQAAMGLFDEYMHEFHECIGAIGKVGGGR